MAVLQLFEKPHPDIERGRDIFSQNRFIWVMADSTWTAQKQHRRGHATSNNHGVVARTTHHAMNLATGARYSAFQHLDEVRIHRDSRLIQALLPRNFQAARRRDPLRAL
jgi:hypothetical protein